MKKIIGFLAFLFVLAFILANNSYAEGSNLVPNNSAENVSLNPSVPEYWMADKWGINNSEFEYRDFGSQDLQKSLYIAVSDYFSGDAKWYFEPVIVDPSTVYIFKNHYISSTSSEVILRLTDFFGNSTYVSLGELSPTTNWTQSAFSFITLPTTSKVTVMHVIKNNGYLWTDNFSLSESSTVTVVDNVPNNSLEETSDLNPNVPLGWKNNKWGTNEATFTYRDIGHTGEKSAMVEIISYSSGDAKWYYEPQPLTSGKSYQVSNYYQSNVSTRVVVAVTRDDDSVQYIELPVAPVSASWANYIGNFTAPANSKNVTVYHLLDKVGYLIVDDYSVTDISATPTPTNTPTPTITPTATPSPTPTITPTPDPIENLVPNYSVETASSSTLPQSWTANSWGTNNAAFAYLNEGHTGNKSVKVEMTSYTDGDAKWYFTPQTVESGKTYSFSDYYKSNISSRVVIWYQRTGGVNEYVELDSAPASSDWNKYESIITVPSGVENMTVFHLISQTGYLITDDYVVEEIIADGNPVPNSSVETASANPNIPAQWSNNKWGANNAAFTYLDEGHTGNKSVKVEITSYSDGDAKWYFTPQPLTAGEQYLFSDYYKSNVQSRVVLQFGRADGTVFYQELSSANSASSWTKYQDTFSVPSDAVTVTVLHLLSTAGWLIIDDYSIEPHSPNGFNRAFVTLTFDDGWEENVDTALPLMQDYAFKSTQFYATTFIENNMYEAVVKIPQFRDAGHEIGSHTVTHPDLTTLTSSEVDYELSHSKEVLEDLVGLPIRNFASPYGAYNGAVNTQIASYYESHRTVNAGYNSKDNFDIYQIKVQNILDTTTAAELEGWVNQALQDKTWLVLVYHRVVNDPEQYDTTPGLFAQQLQVIANSGIPVVTYQEALDEILPQL